MTVRHPLVIDPRDRPPGYPAELESYVTLADGRVVFVRPMVPADREGLAAEIAEADAETLHLRFFTRAIRARPDFVDALVDLDYRERLALVALGPDGEGAGVARYAATGEPEEAQIAVVCGPGWRRVGLASELLDRVQDAARARGITHMTAVYLAGNDVVEALRRSRAIDAPRIRGGLAEIQWELDPMEQRDR